MTQLRHLLYQCSGKDAAKITADKLTNLEALFMKTHKRKLAVEVYMSSWGNPLSPSFGLTAYYSTDQRADVDFLITNIT